MTRVLKRVIPVAGGFIRKNIFIILFFAVLAAADIYFTHNNFIANSDYFVKNDFEITQCAHPEKVWDKVFFGNSVVISSYKEDESSSGYINLGLDYGVVTDLWDMIDKKQIEIGSELVVGLNYLTLYDEFDTNPTYMFHKKWYEPYAYFERDRFYPIIERGFDNVLALKNPMPFTYPPQKKIVYHGMVSDRIMNEKMALYEKEFFSQPIEKYQNNIDALEKVVKYCKENNIRVRVVWMPWNPKYQMPDSVALVHEKTDEMLGKYKVEVLNLENQFGEENFYDSGHFNYDVGAARFTKLMDSWL